MYQNFYFTRPQHEINVEKMERAAKRFMKIAMERKDCEIAAPYYGPVLLEPEIFTSEIHEAMVHLLATDEVLDHFNTTLGIESFGKEVAPEELSIYSDPKIRYGNEWGFYLYDQEGVIPKRTPLIEDGVHVGFLADRHGAQLLSEMLDVDIPAGHSLTQITASGTDFSVFSPQPRINVLDVRWNEKCSQTELKKLFIKKLKEHGLKEGLYVKTLGCPGYCLAEGEAHATYFAPYMMDLKGNLRPVKPMLSVNSARHILRNIAAIGSKRQYCAHRCGDAEEQAEVRASIISGTGLIDNMNVIPIKHEMYGKLFGRSSKENVLKARNRHW
jgi:predicted Zn-dependent protease